MKTSGATGHKTHVASRTRQDALQPGSEKESTFKRRSISELVDPSKQKAFYVGLVEPLMSGSLLISNAVLTTMPSMRLSSSYSKNTSSLLWSCFTAQK